MIIIMRVAAPSRGMDKGGERPESVVKCVQRAIDQAELMADCRFHQFICALRVNI